MRAALRNQNNTTRAVGVQVMYGGVEKTRQMCGLGTVCEIEVMTYFRYASTLIIPCNISINHEKPGIDVTIDRFSNREL